MNFLKELSKAISNQYKSGKRKGNPEFPFYNIFYNSCQYEEDFKLTDSHLPKKFLRAKRNRKAVNHVKLQIENGNTEQIENWYVAKYKGEYYISGTYIKFSTFEHLAYWMPSWWESVTYFYNDEFPDEFYR